MPRSLFLTCRHLRSLATLIVAAVVTITAFGIVIGASPSQTLITASDAYVSEDRGQWTIGTSEVALVLGPNATGALTVLSISRPETNASWTGAPTPDSSFQFQSRRLSPGESRFVFRESDADTFGDGVRLRLVFEDTTSHLRVTRSYAAFPRSPAIEAWSTFEADAAVPSVSLSDISVWEVAVQASEVDWVTGLGSAANDPDRFTRRQQAIAPHLRLEMGATGRSSRSQIPSISLRGSPGYLLTGLLWSGAWGLSVGEPDSSGYALVRTSLGAIATTVKLGQPFETPHGFLGISDPGELNLSAAWQSFVRAGVRHGRSIDPLITYNTWFAHGTSIDEESVRAEMDRAAAVGIELFVVDAGWYPTGTNPSEFSTGLGTWAADARRFPSGLVALRDYAHGLGLKFGIWVEPERVDTATVNRPGLAKERYLATTGGRYNAGVKNDSASAAQICLADGEARQWVFDELVGFLDPLQPDYLKWDNNYWINCDRSGHGHGEADGNLYHTKGLYGILAALRDRYPNMSIENCGSGGNRLDFGMLQYTDAAWMDDQSGPSAHVRHNIEGLTAVFPPAYLLSFVMDDPAEPIHEASDLASIIRSRMPAVLGFSLRFDEFLPSELATMRREALAYKRTRPIIREATTALLSGQIDDGGKRTSDSLEHLSSRSGDAVVYLFAGDGQAVNSTSWPVLLDPDVTYVVRGRNSQAPASGATLMVDGLETAGNSSAAVIVLSRQR